MPPAVEAQSPNNWTAREFPHTVFFVCIRFDFSFSLIKYTQTFTLLKKQLGPETLASHTQD